MNSLGEVVSRRDFMPFGEELYPDGNHRTTNLKYSYGDNVRQKFTGYQKDEETQLDFAEARMYENRHARFTAVDPLLASGKNADPQTFNRYVYVMNNPLIYTDPTGLQTATASGRVYSRGNQIQVFDGDPDSGWKRVRKEFNTTTTINGVKLHLHVRPNGWSTRGRVDGAVFSAPQQVAAAQPRSDISIVAKEVVNGVDDGFTGIAKGVGNAPAVALNAVTGDLTNGVVGRFFFQGSNPLAVPLPFSYNNAREADYGSASSTGTLLGAGVASGTIFSGSSTMSVVPRTNSPVTALAETPQSILMPGGSPIGTAGSRATIREVPGGADAANSIMNRLISTGAERVYSPT